MQHGVATILTAALDWAPISEMYFVCIYCHYMGVIDILGYFIVKSMVLVSHMFIKHAVCIRNFPILGYTCVCLNADPWFLDADWGCVWMMCCGLFLPGFLFVNLFAI